MENLNKSIELITLSSGEEFDDCDIIFIDSKNNNNTSKSSNIKRDLSETNICHLNHAKKKCNSKELSQISELKFYQEATGKSADSKPNVASASKKNENSRMTLSEFWLHDPRCDKKLFYNRIDDDIFDVELYIKALLETLIDSICDNSLLYTVEHYYHQRYRKEIFLKHMNIHRKMMDEYESIYKDVENSNEEFNIGKQQMLRALNHSKLVCKELYDEFQEFIKFIQNLYANKKIVP
ncbi:unnamed protein product [Brachionus calyciflorus]|uniref:Plasmodium RESA N-terminal domain-containing protein n=1 Tax=Brachionus calyciflorus TaxID=104777 RepID=A0A814EH08_9BILA|nr:unnamed protein product [Brachionus calyciflorus]